MGEMVTFPSNGHEASGYLAPPPGGGPGLVVIQEWWGLNDNIKTICERFAEAGFTALAPDLYHGEVTSAPDEARRLAMDLQLGQAARDMSGAVDAVAARAGGGDVGAVGFCLGGGLALALAAHRPDAVRAASPFYGLPRNADDLDWTGMTAAVQGHYAELDQGVTVERVREFEVLLGDLDKDVEILVYEGAQHGFFNDTNPRVHHPEAATAAWQRTVEFMHEHLDR